MPKALNSSNVQVNLQFTADTAQAKRELQQLQATLKSLTTNPGQGGSLSREMAEASRYAAELSVHLRQATNPNTGMLDFSRLNESIKKSGMSLSTYGNQLLSMGVQGRQAFSQLATAVAQSEIPIRRVNSALAQMGTVLKNTIRWQLSSTAIHAFSGAVQTAYNYAKDLNESLNNIRIVTGQNIDQMEKFAATANKAAKELSTSTLDYTNAALIYYQQGLNDKEVEARTNVTMKMANVTRQSAEEVSSQLTAIWNNFAEGSDNLEYFADVITALGRTTASSSAEIAEGLQKFAAIGQTVGLSYEYATSALATIVATTRQSADAVGTALKTLFSRLQGLKLGETLEDGTDLNKYSQGLAAVGVNIKTATGELKDMDVILEETAVKWQTLDRAQKMALAQTVAGLRQYTQFITLMDKWDVMEKNLATAKGSTGALQEQQDIYAQGWEAAAQRVKTAWQDVYKSLINENFFIDLLDFIEKNIKGIKNLIGALGGIPGILTAIGSLVMSVFGKSMAESLTSLTYSVRSLTSAGRQKIMLERQEQLNLMGDAAVYATNSSDPESMAWANNLQTQINLQDRLTQSVDKLDQTERFVTQALMDQVRERGIAVEQAEAEIRKAQEALDIDLERQRIKAKENMGDQFDITKFNTAYLNYKNAYTQFLKLSDFTKTNPLQIIPKNGQIGSDQLQDMQKYVSNFTTQFETLFKSTKFTQADRNLFSSFLNIKKPSQEAVKDFDLIQQKIMQVTNEAESRLGGLQEKLALTGGNANDLRAAIDSEAAAARRAAQAHKDFETSVNNANNFISIAIQKTMTWQQELVSFGTAAMSAGMLFNTLNGLADTLFNKDISWGEKILSSLTSIGIMLPMILNGYKQLDAAMGSIVAKQRLSTIASTTGLSVETMRLGITKMQNILALAKEKITEKEKAEKALALILELEELGIIKKKTAESLKGASYQTIITALKEKELFTTKLINLELLKSPYTWILAALTAILTLWIVITKKIKEQNEEIAKQKKENIDNQADEAIKTAQAISEETKELNNLVKSLKEAKDSKEDLSKIGYDLVRQYEIEDGALLLLQGDYDALIQKVEEYQVKKAQAEKERLLNSDIYTDTNGNFTLNGTDVFKHSANTVTGLGKSSFITNYAPNATARSLIEQAVRDGYLSQDIASSIGYGASAGTTTTTYKVNDFEDRFDFIRQYKELQQFYNSLIHNDANDHLAMGLKASFLDEYAKAYEEETAIYEGLIEQQDIITGKSVQLNDLEQNIVNAQTAYERMLEAINSESIYSGLTDDEKSEKAFELLQEMQGWDTKTIYEYQIITKYSGEDFVQTATLYDQLPNETHKRVFLEVLAKGIKPGDPAWDYIFNQALANSEFSLHNTNVSGLTTARDKFKKGMSGAELDKWASDSGVNWGEQGELGIDRNDFLAMSDTGRESYLYQRWASEREAAYKEAQKVVNIEPKDFSDIEDFAKNMQAQMNRAGQNLTQLEQWYLSSGGNADTFARYKEFLASTNELEEANATILEEKARRANEFATSIEKISSLDQGDKLSTEEFEQMKSSIGESLGQYFVPDGNGKWQLIIDKVEFQEQAENSLSDRLSEKPDGIFSEEQQTQIMNYANSLAKVDKYQKQYNIDNEIANQRLRTLASQYPQISKQVQNYNKALASKDPEKRAEAEEDLRRELKKAEWDSVITDIEKYVKVLNNSKSSNKEIVEANQEIAKSFKQMFDVDVDADWVESHKELFQELYDADAEFINDIALKIQTLMALENAEINGVFDHMSIGFQQLKDIIEANPITVDAYGNADMSNLITALLNAGATAEEVAAVLRAIGQTDVQIKGIGTGIDSFNLEDPTQFGKFLKQLENFRATIKAGGTIPSIQGAGAHDYTQKIGGGSGGGGGKQKKNDIERYHEIKDEIDNLQRAYDQLNKAKDRAWGQDKINLIQAEIDKTEDLIDAQKRYLEQIRENKALDDARAQQVAESLGFTDPYGQTNWTAVQQALEDARYNKEISEEDYTERKKFLDKYIETIELEEEQEDKLQELLYQQQDLIAEKLKAKIDLRIEINELDKKIIETQLKALGDKFYRRIEAGILLSKQFGTGYENGVFDISKVDRMSTEIADELAGWNEIKSKISQEAYISGMKDVITHAADNIEELISLNEQMETYYSSALNQFTEDLERQIKPFHNLIEEFDHYSKLLELAGHEKDYDKMLDILDVQMSVMENQLDVDKETQRILQEEYDARKANYDARKKEYEDALAAGDAEAARLAQVGMEAAKDSLYAAQDALDEIDAKVREDIEQIAEYAQQKFTTTLDKIYDESDKALTGGLGFDYLSQTMDLASKRAEEFLTKTNQIYETNVLLNKITKDIDKTSNQAAKSRLNEFSKEIQALQEKGELSQYELKDAQARYEILKAQIALEEAQNAKSTIRLQRDTEGSYGYVYTADRDKIDEAQENLLKAQNDRYNLALETQQEYLRKFYDTEKEANDALRQLDEDYAAGRIASEEEYRAKRQQIIDYYSGLLEGYELIHTQALSVMHETSAQGINDSWTETFVGKDGLVGKSAEWRTQSIEDEKEVDAALKELSDTLDKIVEPEFEDWKKKIDDTKKASEELRDEMINKFLPDAETQIKKIGEISDAWTAVADKIQAVIEKLEEYMQKAKLAAETSTPTTVDLPTPEVPETPEVPPLTTTSGTAGSGGGGGIGIGSGGGTLIQKKYHIYAKIKNELAKEVGVYTDRNDAYSRVEGLKAWYESQGYQDRDNTKNNFYELWISQFKSGGYTGDWIGGSNLYNGKLAMLHEKELVLNQDDTKNMLAAVHLVREINHAVDLQAQMASGGNLSAPGYGYSNSVLEQTVTIHAEFPNAVNHNEIEEAFNNLVNRASQYANRK